MKCCAVVTRVCPMLAPSIDRVACAASGSAVNGVLLTGGLLRLRLALEPAPPRCLPPRVDSPPCPALPPLLAWASSAVVLGSGAAWLLGPGRELPVERRLVREVWLETDAAPADATPVLTTQRLLDLALAEVPEAPVL